MTISTKQFDETRGSQSKAVPVTTECAETGAFISGPADHAGPIPVTHQIWPVEPPPQGDHEVWVAGPEGSSRWRDQADGFFSEENE